MHQLSGTVVTGYRITEPLHVGSWEIYRGLASDGARVLVTVVPEPPSELELALPFEGIPQLRAVVPLIVGDQPHLAVIESEPSGPTIAELRWPLPIAEVITVGLDLARVLGRMHAAGKIHGALRPQTTWIQTDGDRCSLSGTTPRPELAGLHVKTGTSPFAADLFCPDTLARGEPRSVSSDIAQLGMMLYRMATRTSPFVRELGEPVAEQLARAVRGDIPPWPLGGDSRTLALEELAREAFDPARAERRSLAAILAGLEQHVR